MNAELLESSKEIVNKAIADYKPYAIVLMLSGGDDSMTALAVAKYLNVPITHIMFGNTRTGIQETSEFVYSIVKNEKAKFIEADAGDSYVNYVMRKGFFGVGSGAHEFSYNQLKLNHFRHAISVNIREGKRNRPILFINGARRLESKRREKTMINPIRINKFRKSDIWVNIINEWEKHDCLNFLEYLEIDRNPVSKALCRSGECMCGTMQSKGDRIEASVLFPKWGEWIDALEKAVKAKGFNWGWGEQMPKPVKIKTTDEQFMCTGCKVNFEENVL